MDRLKKTIMLIPPIGLPVPAVGGGAVEQLITHLLEINEIQSRVNIVAVSKYDEQASQFKYKNSRIYYYHTDTQNFDGIPFVNALWKCYCLWLKVFHNRFTSRIFSSRIIRMDHYLFQLSRIAKREKADYVVIEGGWDWYRYAVFDELLGKERIFLHLHASADEDLTVRRIINNSISISSYVRDMWVKDKTIPGTNAVLYNGIDIKKFRDSVSAEQRVMKRKQMGVDDDECLVLYCGRVIPEKGVEQLLEAFDLLRDEKIKLLIIGNADFSINHSTDFSVKIAAKVRDNPNIIALGYIPNDRLPEYYAIADMQVIPSTCQEGAGLVSVEGMAAGLPLIITQSGGMVEYVNSDAAIQVPIDKELPHNLAVNMKLLADDKHRRKKMAHAGRKRAELFSRERYYKSFVDIFEKSMSVREANKNACD